MRGARLRHVQGVESEDPVRLTKFNRVRGSDMYVYEGVRRSSQTYSGSIGSEVQACMGESGDPVRLTKVQ